MATPTREETLYETPAISNDFFQGDIRRGLEKMRLRLLDLTGRNRLLNFRHTKKASLRVVDELPDQLFELLLDGRALRFRPVARPRGLPRPAGDEDDQVAETSVDDGASPSERPPKAAYPTAKEQAARLGINTEYELPPASTSGGGAARYTDRDIQTLHYPEELESILRSINSSARLAIEETGTNMLYLVAGFLEWYESTDSKQMRVAPLVLLPVSLQRDDPDQNTRTYQYAIRSSGEDVLTNTSLQERLRRDFGLELPDIEDDDTPEAYFEKLEPILTSDERWRVRRQMTLALLSFGKLSMYRDLDANTWPAGKSPADHPRIKEFFEGVQREGISFASEYPLDDPAMQRRVPPVVDEADSSQHSALVDALEGRNLVIEGPPGTGKSQTITNLIAAALVKGKRVLFVSEKLAALEVVRHRLDKVGLGAFCLELHSHKSQKRKLLEDIDTRIKLHRRFAEPQALEEKLRMVDADRQVLTDYVRLINQSFGSWGQSLHEVIWSSQRRRKALRFDGGVIDGVVLPEARALSVQALADCRQRVSIFATQVREVLGAGATVKSHPWYGVENSTLTFINERTLLEPLESSVASARALSDIIAQLIETVGAEWLPSTLRGVRTVSQGTNSLPREAGDIVFHLLPKLRDSKLRQRLGEFAHWVRRHEEVRVRIVELLGNEPALGPTEINQVSQLLEQGKRIAPGASIVEHFGQAATESAHAVESIREARAALTTISRGLVVEVPFTRGGLRLARVTLSTLRACPMADLTYRHPGLEREGAAVILRTAAQEAEPIREQCERLSKRFDLRLMPDLSELSTHVVTAANARWWSFLVSEFRATRRHYMAMARDTRKPTREDLLAGLRELLEFSHRRARLEGNLNYRECGGPHFEGVDSPWDALERVASWRADTQGALAYAGAHGRLVADSVWAASSDQVRTLRESDGADGSISTLLGRALEQMDSVVPLIRPGRPVTDEEDLDSVADELRRTGNEVGVVADGLRHFGLAEHLLIADTPEVLRLLAELHSLETLIASSREIADALQESFGGVATDLGRVARTLTLFETVMAAAVPGALKDWLLAPEVPERLTQIHRGRTELEIACKTYLTHWATFEKTGGVKVSEWVGAPIGLEDVAIADSVTRAERAIAGRATLPAWLDYLRAREAVEQSGLSAVSKLAQESKIAPEDLVPAFDYIAANSLVQEAFHKYPTLARFSGLSHGQIRNRFARLDKEAMHLYRANAARVADQRTIPAGNGSGPVSTYTELHLLEREIEKQRRHLPIRQLMLRAGRALQALKPCYMMGPLSVAQYLAPGALEFDLVIMDEASQLKPEDALGTIARAKQVVVVGDRMQLPPTSFFDRIGEDEDQEQDDGDIAAQALSDAESILDVASAVYKPARLLRWHYRSRHGSLIAFSNKEFYKGQLIAFPSPVAKSAGLGVKLVHVRDGVYENRRNLTEARRVVDTALRHMRERPDESLGIVTLNSTQRELAEGIFEQQLKSDSVAQRYVESRADGLEPFFIKNLENVQGDERDVIYISVTYGPTPAGHVFQRFGPINGATGHRRLNVLFTRARRRVVVFSSMLPDQIQAGAGSAWGVRALKGYLQFARTGNLEQASFSGREPDSDFEIEVASALRARGFDCVAQVGVAGYYIDLAVKHPTKPDTFILGIECDGWTYHSSVTARDRDRLRQTILEDLGWKIHRIWSTDWFKASSREVERIAERIEALLHEEAVAPLAPDDDIDEEVVVRSGRIADARGTVEEDGWQGEVESQPFSVVEVRQELLRLRDEIERDLPSQNPSTDLLRNEMIEAILRSRPQTREDWLRKVSLELRLNTDGPQLQGYLERVLRLTSRLSG